MAAVSSRKTLFRKNRGDKVWWVEEDDVYGNMEFTFDKKKVYNLFRDYPEKLSVKEWMVFNEENPYWKNFFERSNDRYIQDHFEEIARLGGL